MQLHESLSLAIDFHANFGNVQAFSRHDFDKKLLWAEIDREREREKLLCAREKPFSIFQRISHRRFGFGPLKL